MENTYSLDDINEIEDINSFYDELAEIEAKEKEVNEELQVQNN